MNCVIVAIPQLRTFGRRNWLAVGQDCGDDAAPCFHRDEVSLSPRRDPSQDGSKAERAKEAIFWVTSMCPRSQRQKKNSSYFELSAKEKSTV